MQSAQADLARFDRLAVTIARGAVEGHRAGKENQQDRRDCEQGKRRDQGKAAPVAPGGNSDVIRESLGG